MSDDKLYKHLGYSPGEEFSVALAFAELPENPDQAQVDAMQTMAFGVFGEISTIFSEMVQFVTENPKPTTEPEADNWSRDISEQCVRFNQALTMGLLDVLKLLKCYGVDEGYMYRKMEEILKKEGISENIFFSKYIPKTVFAYASFIVHQKYNIGTNIRIEARNIKNDLLTTDTPALFTAGNFVGIPQMIYMKMFMSDAFIQYNRCVLLHKEVATVGDTETMKSEAMKALISYCIVLVFMGYDLENLVVLIKSICEDESQ